MLTNSVLTLEKVEAELAELEFDYRRRKKKLRALLAVLETEITTNEKDATHAK
jgi:hypothetical protein